MKDFNGKNAVITGAASGIGYALSEKLAKEGMNIVLADIEQEALETAVEKISEHGVKTLESLRHVLKSFRQQFRALLAQYRQEQYSFLLWRVFLTMHIQCRWQLLLLRHSFH